MDYEKDMELQTELLNLARSGLYSARPPSNDGSALEKQLSALDRGSRAYDTDPKVKEIVRSLSDTPSLLVGSSEDR